MCELKSNGGNRCEYSNALYNEKKKLKRTKKYKESSSYKKESLLLELEENFNINNPSLFKNHLKKREWWQTKARPLPQEKLVELEKKFSKPKTMDFWAALEHTKSLMEENNALQKENNDKETLNALNSYRFTSYILVNDYLRTRLKNEFKELPDYSDPGLIEEEKIGYLKSLKRKRILLKKSLKITVKALNRAFFINTLLSRLASLLKNTLKNISC